MKSKMDLFMRILLVFFFFFFYEYIKQFTWTLN